MPSFSFDISGLDGLQAALTAMPGKVKYGASVGLYQHAEIVMTASKQVCPVDTGTLMGSGHVGKHIGENEGVEEGPVYEQDGQLQIDIGYGGPAAGYALYVHEELDPNAKGHAINWSRPGSGPKYLESPSNELQDQLPGRIASSVESALKG
jgi:hypothetical protein